MNTPIHVTTLPCTIVWLEDLILKSSKPATNQIISFVEVMKLKIASCLDMDMDMDIDHYQEIRLKALFSKMTG